MKPFFLKTLLFPPRCAACGKLMRPVENDGRLPGTLCPDCAAAFEAATRKECRVCTLPFYLCRCMPGVMQKAGVSEYVKVAPYTAGGEPRVPRKLVLFMKDHARRDVFTFAAGELKAGIADALRRSAARYQRDAQPLPDTVIAYLPRDRSTVRVMGHDQARELAKALSAVTGIPVRAALTRVRRTETQKNLGANERMENLRGAFAAKDVRGLRVLLTDDVVTTGAGMTNAAKALYDAGAAEVLAVSFAYTPKLH